MKKSPCYDCDKRKTPCHDTCDRYKEYRAKIDAEKDLRKEQGEMEAYRCAAIKRYWRIKREKNSG